MRSAKKKKSYIKVIFIIANCTWYIYNFRKDLFRRLQSKGYKIILISAKDNYYKDISKYLFRFERLFLIRGSENPIFELITLLRILFLYLKYRPKFVHNFTIKPCIYGSLVARITRTNNIINHITGLGPSFFSKRKTINIINKILNPIYKYSFSGRNTLNIFHNMHDRDLFINKKFTSIENTEIIQGSGVDIFYFKENCIKDKFNEKVQILFPARLIEEKGIIELIIACNELWEENYKFTLNLAGDIDKQNKSYLKEKFLKKIILNKNINFIGRTNNILKIYNKTDIVVLPSWREGLSKSLLESASMSLPIITTDVPGCKEVIKHEYSGILVPPRNANELKNGIRNYLENPSIALQYGQNARKSVVHDFSLERINNQILKKYETYFS